MKPFYEQGRIAIYHADCREVLPELEVNYASAIVTDPPYNVGKSYNTYRDDLSDEAYAKFCGEWFDAARRITYRIAVFPGHGNLPMWLRERKPSAIGCWHKPGGSGRSILGVEEWEPWLYWCGDKGALGGSSVLTCKPEPSTGSGHPCPKPVALMRQLIQKLRVPAVVDPFMGSGSTLLAAKELECRAIGIEIDERYCEIAADRLSQGSLFASPTAEQDASQKYLGDAAPEFDPPSE